MVTLLRISETRDRFCVCVRVCERERDVCARVCVGESVRERKKIDRERKRES